MLPSPRLYYKQFQISFAGFAWLLWQGFDHGNDKSEFESQDKKEQQLRKHLDKRLSLAAVDSLGNIDSYVFFLLKRINDKP